MPILHLSGIDFHIFVGGGGEGLENIGFLVHWKQMWQWQLETNQMECVCQM